MDDIGSERVNSGSDVTLIPKKEVAVEVDNAVFEYDYGIKVLNRCSVKINKGEMSLLINHSYFHWHSGQVFAILGSSGAGKTTLVRAIIGNLRLQSGSVLVFGVRPGSKHSDIPGPGVGYMPQELALFDELTFKEILTYYGLIYKMSMEQINIRINDLTKFLNLPKDDRLVAQLSGGQQRRVSIAITLIHNPKLIILDEPTVGVDSMLRYHIWKYLNEICANNGQTVIIITHYVEEARNADCVAFLSKGVNLKQDNPEQLLRYYKCQTLESVFYILTQHNRARSFSQSESEEGSTSDNNKLNEQDQLDNGIDSKLSLKRITAILWKYNTVLMRNYVFAFAFLIVPVGFLFSTRYAFAKLPRDIPVGVFNQDLDYFSKTFIESVDKHYIDLRSYATKESAIESIVNGTNYLSFGFLSNFSLVFERRFQDMDELSEEDIDTSQIKLYIDFSNLPMSVLTMGFLVDAFKTFLIKMRDQLGANVDRYFQIVQVEEVIHGDFELSLADQLDPAALLCEMQVAPLIISALHIILLRKNDNLERDLVAGVRPLEILAAHYAQTSALVALQTLVSMLIAFGVNGSKQSGSYVDVFALLFVFGLQAMTLGLTGALVVQTINGMAVR